MDIAFIVTEFPSLSETFVLNQVVGLLERGHHVDIFAQSKGKIGLVQPEVNRYELEDRLRYLSCPQSRWQRVIQGARFCSQTLSAHRRPVLGALNIFRHGRQALSLSLLFATIPFYRHYDIVHCHFGPNGLFGATLKKLGLQKRLVVTFHGYDVRLGIKHGRSFYRTLWEEADCVLAISPYNHQQLLNLGADSGRILAHPVGIDLNFFRPSPAVQRHSEKVRLLSVGRLVPEKGHAFAIRALRRVLEERPMLQVRYDIIGEGPLRSNLQQLIHDLSLTQNVFLCGARERMSVVQALRESDLFLAPSLAEALPVSIMEALAVELPVLATKVGSVDQVVQDGRSGFLVAPGDAFALSQKLQQLIEQPARWEAMGRCGRHHVGRHYDIERLNDRLVQIYEQVLAA